MSEYVIVTDSSADLTAEQVEELELKVLPLRFTMGGKTYQDLPDHGEMDPKTFYDRIRAGEMATTSAANLQEYVDVLTPILREGKDVLILSFSSGLSATCQASMLAGEELRRQFPERKILVVDTLAASLGQGLLVWHAVMRKKGGASIEEVRDWVEANKLHLCHWFTVNDLMHLKRGGRVSAATALVGTMLQIKPVLHVDDEGHLINMTKARGRRASLEALVDKLADTAVDAAEQTVFISHSDCEEDARYVGEQVKARCGVKEIVYNYIGPVIGSHTGTGCVALFFLGTKR